MKTNTIVVCEGDQTGQELLDEALRVLEPNVLGFDVDLIRFDLSLEKRRATNNQVVHDAAAAIVETGLGLKAATITPTEIGSVGSPNRILREGIDGKVIVRTGRRIPGVAPVVSLSHPVAVVRMAVGDAYGAAEGRDGEPGSRGESAWRTERIDRSVCQSVAEFAFATAVSMAVSSTADRSGPFRRSMKACSKRRWTAPRVDTLTSPTIRCSSTRPTPV